MADNPDRSGRCRIENSILRCPPAEKRLYSYSDFQNRKYDAPTETRVRVVRDPDIGGAIERAVDGIGGMCNYIASGDFVVIKPNIMGGNHNDASTFTNPVVTKKVWDMVKECGGNPVVVDSSMIWTKFDPTAERTGYAKWAKENNIRLHNLEELPRAKFDFGEFSTIRKTDISKLLLDADKIINIPALKTHLFAAITVGMKNFYGLLPSVDKGKYHARGINDVIVDVNRAHRADLTIVDGTRGCEGFGPLWCESIPDYNLIIASNDVVCADAVAAKFMGYAVEEVPSLFNAQREGLGNALCEANEVSPHPKDGKWERPHPNTIKFIERTTEFITMFPDAVSWFNSAANFWLGDLAYNPFTNKHMMRPLWKLLNLVGEHGLFKQNEWYKKLVNLNPFKKYWIHEDIPKPPYDALNEDGEVFVFDSHK